MKKILTLTLLGLMGTSIACDQRSAITEPDMDLVPSFAQLKVEVCHLNDDGGYQLITIADPALQAHLDHGDSQPGDPYPGMFGKKFGNLCEPVDVTWTVTTSGVYGFIQLEVYEVDGSSYTDTQDRFVNIQASVTGQTGTLLWKQYSSAGSLLATHTITVDQVSVYDGGGFPCANLSGSATESASRLNQDLYVKVCDVADAPTGDQYDSDVYENRWGAEAIWKYFLVVGDIQIIGS